ncbi:MAG: ATPase domain-containing protein [Methanosarcinales archaeon]|nr:ATPase domain-containing protein [ANME-2 cluster archaeon]MDW7776662.1 ATPase domain-containing protein [Methanosarcinales archaeon]
MAGLDDILGSNEDLVYETGRADVIDESTDSSDGDMLDYAPEPEAVLEPEPKAETFIEPGTSEPLLAPDILSCGIYVLDRSIGGGIPAGSMVYISAATRSMAEVFLYQFTQARKTFYFCTERRPSFIKQDIMNMKFDVSEVEFVDVYGSYFLSPQGEMVDNVGNEFVDAKIVEYMEYNLESILSDDSRGPVTIIVDTFSFFLNLNVNHGMIRRLLNVIYETTKKTGGLTFLYGLKESIDKRLENEIFNTSDAIFDIEMENSADKIVNKLSIPKLRGMTPTAEIIKFKIGEGIQIDTSRDIA